MNAIRSLTPGARPLLAFIIPAVLFLVQCAYVWDFGIDDVGISYRYAAHLADGRGLTWNPDGPRVEGYSNFLWVVTLAGGKWLGFEIEITSKVLGVIVALASLWLLYRLCQALWYPKAWWWLPVAIVAVTPEWAAWSVSGLEIASFAFFLLLMVTSLQVTQPWRVWVLSLSVAGLSLSRPEGFALASIALLIAVWPLRNKADLIRAMHRYGAPAIVLLISSGGLALFRLLYYGYPLPNTVYAKVSTSLGSANQVLQWLVFGFPFFAAWLYSLWRLHTLPQVRLLVAALALVVAQILIVLPVNPVMYLLHRYQIAFLPLLVMVIPSVLDFPMKCRRRLAGITAILLVGWCMQGLPDIVRRAGALKFTIARQQEVAQYLLSLPKRPSIALCDAGRIPYWTELVTHDVVGLCDAEWSHSSFRVESLLKRRPDVYIMSGDMSAAEKFEPFIGIDSYVLKDQSFRQQYGFAKLFPKRTGELDSDYGYVALMNTTWARAVGVSVIPMHLRH